MTNELAQALLRAVLNWDVNSDRMHRPYFQTMAKYKYDHYQQYSTGKRFIESFANWLNQFETSEEKEIALSYIRENLIFISSEELNHIVHNLYPDFIKQIIVDKVAAKINIPNYKVKTITSSIEFKKLLRQSLFLGLSDGAKTDVFRRANYGVISHEQIYLTYELSPERIEKMLETLNEDLQNINGKKEDNTDDKRYKLLFLLDDFSASGTSYLTYDKNKKQFGGKIGRIINELKNNSLYDLNELNIYVVIYLCTKQSQELLSNLLKDNAVQDIIKQGIEIKPIFLIENGQSLNADNVGEFLNICNNNKYYDSTLLEDKHIRKGGSNVKHGFGNCKLPIILYHNTPNNSFSIFWSYEWSKKFKGLFPRVPRHWVLK